MFSVFIIRIYKVRPGSTTIRLRTFCLRHFVYRHFIYRRLLLYTRVQNSSTSSFCFSKSLFSSIPTSTYTKIPFINPTSSDMGVGHFPPGHLPLEFPPREKC